MVNKMKLKISFILSLLILFPLNVQCNPLGIEKIKQRGFVVCGTDINYRYLAKKNDGRIEGFDADICRAVAQAILQDAESFKIVSVSKEKIGKALNSGAVDIMLGQQTLSPNEELKQNIIPVDTMYFDRIVFAVRKLKENSSSVSDYTNAKICVQRDTAIYDATIKYDSLYALNLNFIKFPLLSAVKEAFYLNRCDLIAGDEVFVKGIVADLHNKEVKVLPEEISLIPVMSYVSAQNNSLRVALKGIFSALKVAASDNITFENVDSFRSDRSTIIQNILGINKEFWQNLHLDADWLKIYLQNYGNYTDILKRNFGKDSPLEIDVKHNLPYLQDGLLISSSLL